MRTLPSIRSTVGRRLLVGVAAVALAGGLVGCSGSPIDNIVGGAVDRAIEEAVGGDVDISTDGQIPEGFPETVPLVDGDVVGGAAGGAAGWTVVIRPDSVDRFADAKSALEGAGFTATASNSDATSGFGSFTGTDYNVQLTFSSDTDGIVTAIYVVTPA
jgi:hypothetical protein